MLVAYKDVVKTITSDNGKEFAEHEYIAKKLDAEFYFADPYCSWLALLQIITLENETISIKI